MSSLELIEWCVISHLFANNLNIKQFYFDPQIGSKQALGQSGPENNGNEGVLHIPQSSRMIGVSISDCLKSYPGHLLRESSPSAKMKSMYSTD